MNDDLDTLLRDPFLQPPPDFAQRVMTNLAVKNLPVQIPAARLPGWTEARPAARPTARPGTRLHAAQLLRWLAARVGLVGAGVLGVVVGLSQLASFVFGLWLSAAAL